MMRRWRREGAGEQESKNARREQQISSRGSSHVTAIRIGKRQPANDVNLIQRRPLNEGVVDGVVQGLNIDAAIAFARRGASRHVRQTSGGTCVRSPSARFIHTSTPARVPRKRSRSPSASASAHSAAYTTVVELSTCDALPLATAVNEPLPSAGARAGGGADAAHQTDAAARVVARPHR